MINSGSGLIFLTHFLTQQFLLCRLQTCLSKISSSGGYVLRDNDDYVRAEMHFEREGDYLYFTETVGVLQLYDLATGFDVSPQPEMGTLMTASVIYNIS